MRAKMVEAADTAFRLGMEEGMKQAEMQMAQQQAQQQQEQEAMMAQQQAQQEGMPEEGAPEEMEGQPMEQAPEEMDEEAGNELDQKMNELQDLVAKGEKPSVVSLRKKVDEITELRKSQKQRLSQKQQSIVTSQKKMVDNILAKWEKESNDVTENIEEAIRQNGIKVED